jgi:hypothetical protein
METDAEDSYFVRDVDPGVRSASVTFPDGRVEPADATWTGPKSGIAHVWVELPATAKTGEQYDYLFEVFDPSQIEPFSCELAVTVVPKSASGTPGKPNPKKVATDGKGGGGGTGAGLALPAVIRVREDEWSNHGFDADSALKVVGAASEDDDDRTAYDFYVNVDNKYLRIMQKETRVVAELLENQFTYGLVLVGLALLQDGERRRAEASEDGVTEVETLIARASRALAPILLPMIQSIGSLASDSD